MPHDTLLDDISRPAAARRNPLPWRAWTREPLLHFLLLGSAIFGADRLLHPPDRDLRVITVTHAMRQSMIDNFDEDRERVPTEAELKGMMDAWVASEILYREGKLLGVDRGDDTIRDRIAYKLQLMIFSQTEPPKASDAELRAWFAENHTRFDEPERVSFYLSPPADEAAARRQLAEIEAGHEPPELQQKTRAMVGRPVGSLDPSFGDGFRERLLALPPERWSVLASKDGWHVVRVDSHRPAQPAKIEDVYDEALKIYQTEFTRKRAWEAVQRLRASYTVRYEP